MATDRTMDEGLLRALADVYGVEKSYYDIWGNYHETSQATQLSLLSSMGVYVRSDGEIRKALLTHEQKYWTTVLQPIYVEPEGSDIFEIRFPRKWQNKQWSCQIDQGGKKQSGKGSFSDLAVCEEHRVQDEVYCRGFLTLPVKPTAGYGKFSLEVEENKFTSTIAIYPHSCYLPDSITEQQRKLWGLSLQLYSLRSSGNWGMGDFSDLQRVVELAAPLGVSFIGINPLHALFPSNPALYSPYSPSSRQALNIFYLDIESMEDYRESKDAQKFADQLKAHGEVAFYREPEFIDYPTVMSVKMRVFEELFRHFHDTHLLRNTKRAKVFAKFIEEGGEDLRNNALYEVLTEYFRSQHSALWGWPVWPEPYRNPGSKEVLEFEALHANRVKFYQYLQWQADLQLKQVTAKAEEAGMPVGLYLDLALGVNMSGAEAWSNRECYAFQASAGAPPDLLNVKGQVWGLPPHIPHKLREQAYAPYIKALRYNMRYSGALRIDHAMYLMRLFWVPEGSEGKDGAYVRYNLKEMMGILTLESHLNKCLVIGEDLGTVPDEVRNAMAECEVLSYKVLYFMKDYKENRFLQPVEYPGKALVTTSTHDLPPLSGFWNRTDLAVRKKLDLFTQFCTLEGEAQNRKHDQLEILKELRKTGLLATDPGSDETAAESALSADLSLLIHVFLARSGSCLQAVQLEDILLLEQQMNLPGTTKEHPNWKRRLPKDIEAIFADTYFRQFCRQITAARDGDVQAPVKSQLLLAISRG